MRYFMTLALFLIPLTAYSSPAGTCDGAPGDAVVELPSPLSEWGQLRCTPYGYIITSREGWIWTFPTTYSPVMIPSQMVRQNPEPLGSRSYFTRIEMEALHAEKADAAIKMFEAYFDKSKKRPVAYSLVVSSNSGKTLKFNFFDFGNSLWGMWCNKECEPSSWPFMLLDMAKSPN